MYTQRTLSSKYKREGKSAKYGGYTRPHPLPSPRVGFTARRVWDLKLTIQWIIWSSGAAVSPSVQITGYERYFVAGSYLSMISAQSRDNKKLLYALSP